MNNRLINVGGSDNDDDEEESHHKMRIKSFRYANGIKTNWFVEAFHLDHRVDHKT